MSTEPIARYGGYFLEPRAIGKFPTRQRDLARELLYMAAYTDSLHKQFGVQLKRGQVATTYHHLAVRLGWKTAKAARYQLKQLGQTWGQTWGQTLGQTRHGNILVITIGGYNELQRFETYANDAEGPALGRPKGNNRTELSRTEREEEEAAAIARGGVALSLSLSELMEKPGTEDPTQFRREAKAIYDAAVAGGYVDANKRQFRLKDKPDEFSPMMNRPHGLGVELLGLLITGNPYYRDKDVNLGQLRHFIEGGDLFTADTSRGFERAGLLHLLPGESQSAQAAKPAVASIDKYRRVDREARQGREFTSAGDVLKEIAGPEDSSACADPIEQNERENFERFTNLLSGRTTGS